MGADLTTFICKGPRDLNPKKKDQAVELAKSVIAAVNEYFEMKDPTDKDKKLIQRLTGLDIDDLERYEVGDLDPEEVVDNLYCAWGAGFRDCNARTDPDDDKQAIVVAGDMSWGDEPDGGGYQAFKYASMVGLFEFFGIR
jgi:hypothetical protein